ncbi:MAG: hypothetical protein AAF903_12320 [Pseudomonadota bacterium]
MGYTQKDIERLKKAMATGARRVKIKEHETEFRSVSEMQRLLGIMERDVVGAGHSAVSIPVVNSGL